MEQLGYLSDPADRLGMLDGQRMRAARVVLDIGVHLGKPRPDGQGPWDADFALDFMLRNVNMPDEFVKFEVNRYLGWPGQAAVLQGRPAHLGAAARRGRRARGRRVLHQAVPQARARSRRRRTRHACARPCRADLFDGLSGPPFGRLSDRNSGR